MSPPEIWGPAIWTLFHTLCERIDEKYYEKLSPQLFYFIVRICKFLPCPECASDATAFLAKIKFSDLKTKQDLKNVLYLFHNSVNAKKKKPLFNYGNMEIYGKYNLIYVVNNFLLKYQTKGNMKLLSESFQRQITINEFKAWFMRSIRAFVSSSNPVTEPVNTVEEVTSTNVVEEPNTTVKEEPSTTVEEVIITNVEEELNDTVEEILETTEEKEILKPILVNEEQTITKSKRGRKSKKKN